MWRPNLIASINGFTRPTIAAGLLILGTVPSECMAPAYGPETGPHVGEFAPGGQGYGLDGGLVTAHQLAMVQSLGWPQSREDMVGTLGYPHGMTAFADYYTAPGGQTLVIHYSGPVATGYSLE